MSPRWLIGGDAPLDIASDGPTVWLFDIDAAARRRAEEITPLPDEAAGFARAPDAGDRLLRRRLTRLLLATAAGCRPSDVAIARSPAGAPLVDAPFHWHMSVAARWPAAAIAIARHPIGVDVEVVGEMLPPDLLTAAERERLRTPASDAASWAAKEAHAKWTGYPRHLEPSDIVTHLRHRGPTLGTTAPPGPAPGGFADPRTPRWNADDGIGEVISRFGTTRCWLRATPTHVAALCAA